MIQYIRIQNFRSVKDIALELGPLNIVTPAGCKSPAGPTASIMSCR